MAHYVTSIKTSLSVEEAFDYMSDLRNFQEWDPGVSSSEKADGDEVGKDSEFDVVANGTELTYVLVEFDRPNRAVAEANTNRLRSYDIIEVSSSDTGSIVTYDATLELKGVFKLFSPVMSLLFDRIGSQADDGLQRVLPDAVKVS